MRLSQSLLALFAAALAAGLLASCGDDDSPAKPDGSEPPAIESPQIIDSVDMNSENQVARAAEAMVNATLTAAKAPAVIVNSVLGPTASADWGGDGGCWVWTYEYGTCTTIYKVCPTGSGFEWTVVLGGDCDGAQYDDWVVLRGETDADGQTGTLRFYETNTTNVEVAVAWTRAADDLSGTWTFYDGDVGEENVFGTLEWAVTDTGSGELTWEFDEQNWWYLTYSLNGGAGSMEIYDLDGEVEIHHLVNWNADGTGLWQTWHDGQIWNAQSW